MPLTTPPSGRISRGGRLLWGSMIWGCSGRRHVPILHLPCDHGFLATRNAFASTVQSLPPRLWRSLPCDQGMEMAAHQPCTKSTDIRSTSAIRLDPDGGSKKNTNGLLRQHFPRDIDLSSHTPKHLEVLASELNSRPRRTLDWSTPAEHLAELRDPVS